LLKHDYVVMPIETVRWIELVFGEGLSAEEATRRISEESVKSTEEAMDQAAEENTEEATDQVAEESADDTSDSEA
jgi:large subunit ribosomal protein L4